MKFPARIYLKWDERGPYLIRMEGPEMVAADDPELVGVYRLVQEVKEWKQAEAGRQA